MTCEGSGYVCSSVTHSETSASSCIYSQIQQGSDHAGQKNSSRLHLAWPLSLAPEAAQLRGLGATLCLQPARAHCSILCWCAQRGGRRLAAGCCACADPLHTGACSGELALFRTAGWVGANGASGTGYPLASSAVHKRLSASNERLLSAVRRSCHCPWLEMFNEKKRPVQSVAEEDRPR